MRAAQGEGLASSLDNLSIAWTAEDLPILRSALNTIDLIRTGRLSMMIWAGGHPTMATDTLVGLVNLKLENFMTQEGVNYLFEEATVCNANLSVGKVHAKLTFKQRMS